MRKTHLHRLKCSLLPKTVIHRNPTIASVNFRNKAMKNGFADLSGVPEAPASIAGPL